MNKTIQSICETAIMIALAVLLDYLFKLIPILAMPNGGRFSLTMLPLLINGYRNGLKWGVIGGIGYAIINFMLDGFFWHWGSIIFDYLLAFGVLGITGLFKKKGSNLGIYVFGIILACFLRYIFHSLSGVIFFSEYAEAWFSENPASFAYGSVFLYSFIIYNGPYMLASSIGCVFFGILLHKRLYRHRKKVIGNG